MEESKLVRRMKSGDKEAFDELYTIYCRPLLRTVYLLLGNRSDAEDVVQDTFVKAFLHVKELKKEEGFRSWLYQIATRTAWEYGRKKQRELPDDEVEKKADEQLHMDGTDLKSTTEQEQAVDVLIRREENETLWHAIEELEAKQKLTVILYYYNEFSTAEIAGITGTLEGTVKSRLFTARRNLKAQIERENTEQSRKGGLEYGKI